MSAKIPPYDTSASEESFSLITSAATCGGGDSFAERTIAVSAYMPQGK